MSALDELTDLQGDGGAATETAASITPTPTGDSQAAAEAGVDASLNAGRQDLNQRQQRQTQQRWTGAQFASMPSPLPPNGNPSQQAPRAATPESSTQSSTWNNLDEVPQPPQPVQTSKMESYVPPNPQAIAERSAAVSNAASANGGQIDPAQYDAITADVDYRHAERRLGALTRMLGIHPEDGASMVDAINSGNHDSAKAGLDAYFQTLYSTPEASANNPQSLILRTRLEGIQKQAHGAIDGMRSAVDRYQMSQAAINAARQPAPEATFVQPPTAPASPDIAPTEQPTAATIQPGVQNTLERTAITAAHGFDKAIEGALQWADHAPTWAKALFPFLGGLSTADQASGMSEYLRARTKQQEEALAGKPVTGTSGKQEQLAEAGTAGKVISNVAGGLIGSAPGIAAGGIPGLIALGTQAAAGASAEAHDRVLEETGDQGAANKAGMIAAAKTLPSTLLFAGAGGATSSILKKIVPLEASPFARAATALVAGTGANLAATAAGKGIVGENPTPNLDDVVNSIVFAAHGGVTEHQRGQDLATARSIITGTHPEVAIVDSIAQGKVPATPEQQALAAHYAHAIRDVASRYIEGQGYKAPTGEVAREPQPGDTAKSAKAREVTPSPAKPVEPAAPAAAAKPPSAEPGTAGQPPSTAAPEVAPAEASPFTVQDVQKSVMNGAISHAEATTQLGKMGLNTDDIARAIGQAPSEAPAQPQEGQPPAQPATPPPAESPRTGEVPPAGQGELAPKAKSSEQPTSTAEGEQSSRDAFAESDEQIAQRTTEGPERSAAFSARSEAGRAVRRSLKEGDRITEPDGTQHVVTQVPKRGESIFVQTVGEDGNLGDEREYTLVAGDRIERSSSSSTQSPAGKTASIKAQPEEGTRIVGPALRIHGEQKPVAVGELGQHHQHILGEALGNLTEEQNTKHTKDIESKKSDTGFEHVFVDDKGNVLDRKQAFQLAKKAGQITSDDAAAAEMLAGGEKPELHADHLIKKSEEPAKNQKAEPAPQEKREPAKPKSDTTAAHKLAKATLQLHAKELQALGHPLDFEYGPVSKPSGIVTDSETGRIKIDLDKFAASIERLGKQKGTEWVKRVIPHEIFHLGTIAYAKESPENMGRLLALNMDDDLMQRAEEAYGPEWEGLSPFAKAAEAARMLGEGPEKLTEASYKFLKDFLKWLRAKLDTLSKDTRELIRGIEEKLGRYQKEQQPTKENAPPAKPQRVRLGNSPQSYEVVEQLPPQKGDQPGEKYFRVKNERTGEVQTVEQKDMKPIKGAEKGVPTPPTPPSKTTEAMVPMPPKTTTPEPPKSKAPAPPAAKALSPEAQKIKDALGDLLGAASPVAENDLGAATPENYALDLPEEKMEAFVKLARDLKATVKTPEDLAQKLGELGEKAKGFSQSLWFMLKSVGAKGPSEPNWGEIYGEAKKEVTPAEKPARREFKVRAPQDEHFAADPIVQAIAEHGGLMSKSTAQKKFGKDKWERNKGEWDDAPKLSNPTHNSIYKTNGLTPDEMAQVLVDNGLLKANAAPPEMWAAIDRASQSAARMRGQQSAQRKEVAQADKQDAAFRRDAKQPQMGDTPIDVGSLHEGDVVDVNGEKLKVVSVDPDTFDVTLEDHLRYGIQHVQDGEILYGQVEKAPESETEDLFAPEKPAPEAKPLPKLRTNEKGTAELFQGEDQPFNLMGESGVDTLKQQEAKDKAEREASEAKAKQDREQLDIFNAQSETHTKGKVSNDIPTSSSLETSSAGAGAREPGGESGVQTEPDATLENGRHLDDEGSRGEDPAQSGALSSDVPSAPTGVGRAEPVQEPAPAVSGRTAGDEQPAGSRPDHGDRQAPDAGRPDDVDASLTLPGGSQSVAGGSGTGGSVSDILKSAPVLQPEQAGDVAFIEKRLLENKKPGVLLTNGTGTGKTFSGLGTVKRFLDNGANHIIITAPSDKVVNDWIDTAKEHFGVTAVQLGGLEDNGAGTKVVVTTYANFGQNDSLVKRPWDLVVTDETHYLSQDQKGNVTLALSTLRALTFHPDGVNRRVDMMTPTETARLRDIRAIQRKQPAIRQSLEPEAERLIAVRRDAEAQVRRELQQRGEAGRPKTLMLSATPFAYHYSLDVGNGYLFDFPKEPEGRGYNTPSGRGQFYAENFGYRMRYGKLTKPENAVATGILERRFAEKLKRDGAMSGRMLNVDKDYNRDFVLMPSEVGAKVDEVLSFIRDNPKFRPLEEEMGLGDYLNRRYLLEALKAREAIGRIKQHLALGRKVIVFHDYKKGGAMNPLRPMVEGRVKDVYSPQGTQNVKLDELFDELKRSIPGFEAAQKELDGLMRPLQLFQREFPDAQIFNGDVPKAERRLAVKRFNTSGSKYNVILVQRASGKEGISLHDTDGLHQRVLIDLGIPGRPTDSIQCEGRGYRVGVMSNFPIEYLVTGTNFERWTFAQTIAQRSSTAENLAMGEQARSLLQSFADGFNDAKHVEPSDKQGVGGKEKDRAREQMDPFKQAVALYYTNQKKTARTKSAEGVDYFPTPEPLGYKMVEWSGVRPGEKILEPSAGHGAIARFFPDSTNRHAVEPSNELAGRLALNATDTEVHNQRFEDYYVGNKFHAIVMNPPWGVGGKTAIEHLGKAAQHLYDGGRIVALIPSGGMADRRFEQWMESDAAKGIYLRADIKLPGVTFERAGTGAIGRIVVLDKSLENKGVGESVNREISADDIKGLFDRIEHMGVPDRPEPAAKPKEEEQPQTPAQQLLSGRGGRLPYTAEGELQPPSPAAIARPDQASTWSPTEFNHTKTGKPVFVAKIMRRLGDAEYKAALAAAKEKGGYYSAFKGAGAVPGFHFKTAEARDAFIGSRSSTGEQLGAANPIPSEELGAANPIDSIKKAYDKAADAISTEMQAAKNEIKLRGTKEKITYKTDAATNLANYYGQQAGDSIRLDLPEKKDREAMPFVIEAAGDPKQLQKFKNQIANSRDPKLATKFKPIIEHAIAEQARLTKAGKNHENLMKQNMAELTANNIDVPEAENYVTRKLDTPEHMKDTLPNPMFSGGSGQVGIPRYFTKGRSFETLADAIEAGYPPISTDLADLDAHRIEAAKKMILQKQMFDELKLTPSPTNGEPIIGKMQQRKLANGDTEATVPRGYSVVQAAGTPLVVHNDFANVFRDLFGGSAIRQTTIGRAAMKTAAFLKHGTLAIDTFHIGRMLLKMAAAGGGAPLTVRNGRLAWNIHKGRALLEYSDQDLGRAVSMGDITQEEADYAKANRDKIEGLIRHGMNVGRVADNLMQEAKLHLPIISNLNDWIFGKLSRSAMLQSALGNLERNLANPSLSKEDAYRQTAREMNQVFGNLQNQGLLRNKTLQDISRLIFLAPNWTESQAGNEARAYAQAGKAAYNAARGRGFRVGNSARIFAAGFVGLLVANQIINFLSRGQTTFQNKEDGHKLDAWVPGGKRGFWFDPLEIAGEYAHAAEKYTAQHENPVDVAAHIASNKLSPLARGLKEGLTGRDYAGRHFLNNADRIRAAITDMVPIPLVSGAFFEKDPRAPLGYRVTRQPGAFEKQLLQSVGAKLTAAQSPRTQMFEIAQPFRADRGRSDTAGEYTEMRRAIDNDQLDNARSEIEWLKSRGKSLDAITHAMGIRKGGQIAPELFTGSQDRENEMLASLTPSQLEIYQQAQVDHLNNALKFLNLLKQLPPEPPQPKTSVSRLAVSGPRGIASKTTFDRL